MSTECMIDAHEDDGNWRMYIYIWQTKESLQKELEDASLIWSEFYNNARESVNEWDWRFYHVFDDMCRFNSCDTVWYFNNDSIIEVIKWKKIDLAYVLQFCNIEYNQNYPNFYEANFDPLELILEHGVHLYNSN